MHWRTVVLLLALLGVLVCANLISLTIPFGGEQEEDGYMIKLGWPCAFREETRHKLLWEWNDFAIDIGVAVCCLLAVGISSEWIIRNQNRNSGKLTALKMSYVIFLILLAEAIILIGLNLHEFVVDDDSVRGWPMTSVTIDSMEIGPFQFHHQIQPIGLAVDFAVAVLILGGTLFALRRMAGR